MDRVSAPEAGANWLGPPQLKAGTAGAMPVVAAAVMVAAAEPMPPAPAAEPKPPAGAALLPKAPDAAGHVQGAGDGVLRTHGAEDSYSWLAHGNSV